MYFATFKTVKLLFKERLCMKSDDDITWSWMGAESVDIPRDGENMDDTP